VPERANELRKLAVSLHPADLLGGGEHAGGRPTQAHVAGLRALHVAGVFPDDLDHRLDRVGAHHGLEQRPGDAKPGDGDARRSSRSARNSMRRTPG
jgi:hypothetical protein